jgi:coenzyme PQQ synthesis protein D (PqqD)
MGTELGNVHKRAEMPEFVRIAWTSDEARSAWEGRIRAISHMRSEIEWHSCRAGLRECALVSIAAESLPHKSATWTRAGLIALPLVVEGSAEGGYRSVAPAAKHGRPFTFRTVVGGQAKVKAFEAAWAKNDHKTIGKLLAYPECCTQFFYQSWVKAGAIDTTWHMVPDSHRGTLGEISRYSVQCDPLTNMLWRWLGVRATFHLPCSFDCEATIRIGTGLGDLAAKLKYTKEWAWLVEMLSWPVEWSSLHGIAEIKTPILKIMARSDYTACKHVLQLTGSTAPAEGAKGIVFPYRKTPPLDGVGLKTKRSVACSSAKVGAGSNHSAVRVSGIKERDVEGDLILYGDKARQGWILNDSAALIWLLIDNVRTADDIAAALATRLGVKEHDLHHDIRRILEEFRKIGVIRAATNALPALPPEVRWEQTAKPQEDDYDTAILERIAGLSDGNALPVPNGQAQRFLMEGHVAVRHLEELFAVSARHVSPAALDHHNMAEALEYLSVWPAVRRQLRRLMSVVCPAIELSAPTDSAAFLSRSRCDSTRELPWMMWSTVNCSMMFAENLVHELAHQKLFALGIDKESPGRWIENMAGELYASPIIRNRLRPMTAVVHAEYALAHVTELDKRIVRAYQGQERWPLMLRRLEANRHRLYTGLGEIRRGLRLQPEGLPFFNGLYAWIEELLQECDSLLEDRRSATHPRVGGTRAEQGPAARGEVLDRGNETCAIREGAGDLNRLGGEILQIFVGTEPRMEKAEVALEHSIRKCTPGPINITWMDYGRGGVWADWKIGRRRGNLTLQDNLGAWATEFSCFRFAVPEANQFCGRALYMDVDMLALRDLREILTLPMIKPALMTRGCSGVILFDCSFFNASWWPRIRSMQESGWNINRYIALMSRHDCIGHLDGSWNCLDGKGLNESTRILHYTRRRTQPWHPYGEAIAAEPHPRRDLEQLWWDFYRAGTATIRGDVDRSDS